MRPCTKVGIEVTWRCNARCIHCYHRRNPKLHQAVDKPLEEVKAEIDRAIQGGLDHVYLVGQGEPSVCPNVPAILDYCRECRVASSMITNALLPWQHYQRFFDRGLDHLHISSHGMGDTLDAILRHPAASKKQAEVKEWLASEGLPFRINTTLQQLNYRELPELVEYEISHGMYHFSFLGFLPHYQWRDHVHEIAVHPAELRPCIEDASDRLLDAGTLFTIRYHPLCHLAPKYWPYVVNANHVVYDPWEWAYTPDVHDLAAVRQKAWELGEAVACKEPCSKCAVRSACGGWNRTYAEAFDGAGLEAIREVPEQYHAVWDEGRDLHDLNPANDETGTIVAFAIQHGYSHRG